MVSKHKYKKNGLLPKHEAALSLGRIYESNVNNPNGWNKHQKNPAPKVEIMPTQQEMILEAKELYIKLWKHKREGLSMAQQYSKLQRQIMGIKKEDLEE